MSHAPLDSLVGNNHFRCRDNSIVLTILLYGSGNFLNTVNSPELFLSDIESFIECFEISLADSTLDLSIRASENCALNLIANGHIRLTITSDNELDECAGNDVLTMHKVNPYDRHTAYTCSNILTFSILNSTEYTLRSIEAYNFLLLVNYRLTISNLIRSLSYRELVGEAELLKVKNLMVRNFLKTVFSINNGEAGSNE